MTTTVTSTTATTSVLQWLEGDVISLIQDVEAGVEVLATDLTGAFTWLGSHIGEIAATVTAVQGVETQLNAAGIPIPAALANGITAIDNAVVGVNTALTGQAIAANGGSALTLGYQATKALQIAAASAASIAAGIQAIAPATPALSPAPAGAIS